LEVIYFLQAGCGKIPGLSIEVSPGEFPCCNCPLPRGRMQACNIALRQSG
jgi:hypothetical protein